MPVFGKSLFETVLDGMDVEEVEDDEEASFVRRPRMTAHFLADTSFADRVDQRPLGELYEDFGEPPPEEPELPPSPEPPDWLGRLSEQDVIDDLGLVPGMTKAEAARREKDLGPNRLVEAALRRA